MQDVAKKINNKLKASGWYDQLRIFLESSDFLDILKELKKKVDEDNQRFCPGLGNAFEFLESIDYSKVKGIIFTDYICNRIEHATGIPFSLNEKIISMSPVAVYQSVDEKGKRGTHDVNNWVKEGVLVIPLALTTRIEGKAHFKLWEPFIMRIIEVINKKYSNVPWILMGSGTWKYEEDIISPHVRKVELRGMTISENQWSQWVNRILVEQGKPPINW